LSSKLVVRDLVEVLAQKGVKNVVISPGSRNAPLIISFNRHPSFSCYSVVDERCAAFFALGIAQQTKTPVVICCTSGSAALNYAPAVVEAYYQKIPLLILTADRPKEWIDQMDGQTIRQSNVYSNYIKGSFDFPVDIHSKDDRWYVQRMTNEAIELTQFPEPGPVHINLPLREPLYDFKDYSNEELPKLFETTKTLLELEDSEISELKKEWRSYDRILVITGLLHPNEALNSVLNDISNQNNVAILTETTSNVFGKHFNRSIDRVISGIEDDEVDYIPDLLVTIGGPVVSKKVKAFLRENKPNAHWHINASNDAVDTYQSLTRIIPVSPEKVLKFFTGIQVHSDYRNRWLEKDYSLQKVYNEFIKEIDFCDLKVFETVLNEIPEQSQLQLANSTVVRYSNLFDQPSQKELFCFSNRGTSGIDGTISTAVGAAVATKKLTTVITGDLSFFYDSNALWITPFPQNLKIILINNKGGSIFRIIDGPPNTDELESFFEAKHDLNAKYIARTFGLDYTLCDNETNLSQSLKEVYSNKNKRASLIEVSTNNQLNPKILKHYFQRLKKV
jgi:2-succinyl-5-enolpyruvyl-6-hydroxy-3-cyclohexene-1-carboxylate synthase